MTTLKIGDRVRQNTRLGRVTYVYSNGEAANVLFDGAPQLKYVLLKDLQESFAVGDKIAYRDPGPDRVLRGVVRYVYADGSMEVGHTPGPGIFYVSCAHLSSVLLNPPESAFTQPTAPAAPTPAIFSGPVVVDKATGTKVDVPEGFVRAAASALARVLKETDRFTTDDLWAKIPSDARSGVEPRAMGGFMVEAAKTGRIKKTSEFRKSTRKECHSRPLAVWARV